MGFEFNGGTLYAMEPSGRQFELDNSLCGDIEVDTLSPNETPSIIGSLKNVSSASFEVSAENISWLDNVTCPTFIPTKSFDIEYNKTILVQAKWHKKKRINKKWLKRYGMKSDMVKMKAKARSVSYDIDTGDCEFEIDTLECIWRPDQLRKHLKIEM